MSFHPSVPETFKSLINNYFLKSLEDLRRFDESKDGSWLVQMSQGLPSRSRRLNISQIHNLYWDESGIILSSICLQLNPLTIIDSHLV